MATQQRRPTIAVLVFPPVTVRKDSNPFQCSEQIIQARVAIYQSTDDRRLVIHLCTERGGYFVPNAPAEPLPEGEAIVNAIGRMDDAHADFEKALARVKKQGGFTPVDLPRVRKRWNRYQLKVEGLLSAGKRGRYAKQITAWLLGLWPTVEALTELAAACG